jgi:hypothetical protein
MEAADMRAVEEAAMKRAAEDAAVKVTANEEVTGKTADEATGAVGDSPAPARHPQWLGPRGRRLQAAPPRQPNVPTRVFGNLGLSSSSFFYSGASFSNYISFLRSSSSFGAATTMGMAASAVGTTTVEAAVGVTLGPAPDGEPQTTEGVPEDVLGESEEEPEVVPELGPEVVREEAPAEGAMITIRTAAAPPPSCGARAPFSLAPRTAVTSGATTDVGMEVVLGHLTPYVPDDISLVEAVSMAHQALSQVQRVLHCEGEDLADMHRCLQLWASMLKRTTMSKRVVVWAR